MNAGYWLFMRKIYADFVYKLEFDTEEKVFLLTQPGGFLGGV